MRRGVFFNIRNIHGETFEHLPNFRDITVSDIHQYSIIERCGTYGSFKRYLRFSDRLFNDLYIWLMPAFSSRFRGGRNRRTVR